MFSKSLFWILLVTTLILGSLWLIKMKEADIDMENTSSTNKKTIVSNIEIKKPNQKSKQGLDKKIAKASKIDGIPSPDELYEQQLNSFQTEFELEPTIPEIEVIPEELKIIEQEAAIVSESFDVDALSENPDQTNDEILMEDELPPSENFIEVIPFELEQMESNFDNIADN